VLPGDAEDLFHSAHGRSCLSVGLWNFLRVHAVHRDRVAARRMAARYVAFKRSNSAHSGEITGSVMLQSLGRVPRASYIWQRRSRTSKPFRLFVNPLLTVSFVASHGTSWRYRHAHAQAHDRVLPHWPSRRDRHRDRSAELPGPRELSSEDVLPALQSASRLVEGRGLYGTGLSIRMFARAHDGSTLMRLPPR
jgi:hypothetical protein